MGCIKVLCIGGAVTIVVAVIIIVPSVLLTSKEASTFRDTFMKRCLEFPEEEGVCDYAWTFFEQAYVGMDQCSVFARNYEPLFVEIPFKHPCGKTMFWSKIYDLVHKFTDMGDCFFTLEDTLLGYVLDQQTWCGQPGSTETFTENCDVCQNNPVNAFWEIASTKFARYACQNASVMLDGERAEPYDPNSFFGSVEVPNLNVTSLRVVLATLEEGRNCSCDSLGSLRKDLDPRIDCSCTAVTKSHIEKCIVDNIPCDTCW